LNRLLPGNRFLARISTRNQDFIRFIRVFFLCFINCFVEKRQRLADNIRQTKMRPKCSLNMRAWTNLNSNVDEAVHD
jgi:hypothetical protein